jgi:hypothetical protein
MNENEEITTQQLVIIRRLYEGEQLDTTNDANLAQNMDQLTQQGLVESNEQHGAFLSTKALRLLTESGLYPNKNESRAEEVVKLYGQILKLEKILTDIEKLDTRPNLTAEEKFKQALGLIRHSRFESTF